MGSFVARLIAAMAALVLALGVAAAAIAETTLEPTPNRAEYVSTLEKACKPGAEETKRAIKNVRHDVREGRIALAAHKFGRTAEIYGGTIEKISTYPRPSGDVTKIKEWFAYLNRQEGYLSQITDQLKAGHTIRAQRLTGRFIHTGNLANNVVLAFGFNYCSFKPSRYGF